MGNSATIIIPTSKFNSSKFITSLLICAFASFVGYLLTNESVQTWYPTLNKPILNPPSWVFGPVWTLLYIMIGLALYLVRVTPNSYNKKTAITFFFIQLALNILWSFSFFMLQSPMLGLINIFILWVCIIITVYSFFAISNIAGWLLVPYLLWVTFASYLNLSIWLNNQ